VRLESLGNAVVLLAVGLAIRGAFSTILPSNTVPATLAAFDRIITVLQSATPPQLAAILAILCAKTSLVVAPFLHGVATASSAFTTSVTEGAPAVVTSAAAAIASALGFSSSTGEGATAATARAAAAVAADSQTQLLRAGLAGLAVSNAMAVTSMLQWAVSARIENIIEKGVNMNLRKEERGTAEKVQTVIACAIFECLFEW